MATHSSTVENYTKKIFLTSQELASDTVPMGSVAEALNVVPGTATSMVKALAKSGLVIYEPRTGVRLTLKGRTLALKVLRRHRLVEYFLVKTLKMDWSEIHDEAEALEHAVSDRLLDRLAQFLGEPRYDPHGDPIPTADGELIERHLVHIAQCQANDRVTVRRISDQDTTFLNFAQDQGLIPGSALTLVEVNPVADCVVVQLDSGTSVTFGIQAAEKIWVDYCNGGQKNRRKHHPQV